MSKYKALMAVIITAIIVTAIIIISSLLKKEEATTKTSDLSVPEEESSEISKDKEVLTVDSVLEDIKPIAGWEMDEYSRATILWNTEDEELPLEGKGYLFGDVIGSEDLREKHDALKVFLRDAGFEHDRYNVASSAPGDERSILKLDGIGCELYIREDDRKASTDMGILCTKLPKEVVEREPEPMSEKIARSIAETSSCVKDGPLKDKAIYNENSKTWWIDLDIEKPGCNPACVIYEDETVEINWRCTGLTP